MKIVQFYHTMSSLEAGIIQSINQSGAMFFSVGDDDLPCISIPCCFQCFCHSIFLLRATLLVHPTSFHSCFPLLLYPSIIPVVTRCSSFSLLITWPKKVAWHLLNLFMSDLVVSALFRLISLQSMRFVAFSTGTTFLLPPVSFVLVLKLSRPCIHTREWVQYSTPGLNFLCELRSAYLLVLISFSEKSFFFFAFA